MMEKSRLLDAYLHKSDDKRISKYFTKILVCIIMLLGSLIFVSINDKCHDLYQKYVFEDTFKFMDFNRIYTYLTGGFKKEPGQDKMVFGNTLEYFGKEKYLNGEALTIDSNVPISAFTGGIVVFIGEKEGFNQTVIIQGSDGYDIWYGNLETVDVKLYDYIAGNTLIGIASQKMYLQIMKDNNYFTYEEYQNQI